MSKKLKILYYSPHPHLNYASASGYGTHMREMVKAFKNLGHEVSLVILGGTKLVEETANVPPSKMKTALKNLVPSKVWESLKDINLLRFDKKAQNLLEEKIQKFQPDLIFERANYIQLSGLNAAKKFKVPHFYEFNSPFIFQRKLLQGEAFTISKAEKIEKEQLAETNCSFVVSTTLKKYFVETYGIDENKMKTLPNAIDPSKINLSNAKKLQSLKEKYGIKKAETVIGFVGSIFPWHGVDILIDAFSEVIKKKENLKLLIVGTGEILSDLKDQVNKNGFLDQVIFTGKVPHEEVFPLIELMDITVMPKSNWYGSPVKLFEYGALQKPIITTDNGPINDIMENGKDGLLIEDNAKSLEAAIEKSLVEPFESQQMAKHFYQRILDNYTWEKNAEKVIDRYHLLKKEN